MQREFVVLLCIATYVSSIAVHQDAPTVSSTRFSVIAQQQDHLAIPSQTSYQRISSPTTKYLPTPAPSYQVNSAVVDTISEANKAKSVFAKSYLLPGLPNGQQPSVSVSTSVAADPSSPEYRNILERYVPAVKPIQPYFSAPLAAKTVSIGPHGAAQGHNVQPFAVYTGNAAQTGSYYGVPVTQNLAASQRLVNIAPSSFQGSTPKPFYPPSTAILESHGAFTVQAPAQAAYPVGKVQLVNPPQQQLIPVPVTYNVNPTVQPALVPVSAPAPVVPAAKQVTIEAFNTVQSHPPPAPKYAPAPIPVPVLYQPIGIQNPVPQQLVVAKAVVPTAETFVQAPARGQAILVPVYASGANLQYQQAPGTGGFVPLQQGYARAVQFSPASEVSRVTFNGLGVAYGW